MLDLNCENKTVGTACLFCHFLLAPVPDYTASQETEIFIVLFPYHQRQGLIK